MIYELRFSEEALADFEYFKKSGNIKLVKKISELFRNISENPKSGIGKPEILKHNFSGYWSRRINKEHRIIYEIKDDFVLVHSIKGHYTN